jgi:transposase-like protein
MTSHTLTDLLPRKERAIELYKQGGHTLSAIAVAVGVHPNTVARWLHAVGYSSHHERIVATAEMKYQCTPQGAVVFLLDMGYTQKQVAALLRMSISNVSRHWKHYREKMEAQAAEGRPCACHCGEHHEPATT